MWERFQQFDDAVFRFVQKNLQQPGVQYVARDITSLGGDTLAALITLFTAGALWLSGSKIKASWFLGTMFITALLIVSLKLLIGRPCPLQPDPYQHVRDFPTQTLSVHLPCMPSGHTAGSTVLYSLIMFSSLETWPRYSRKWRRWVKAWFLTLPPLIGLTRIALSAHWATDVVCGYALGWAIVGASRYAQVRF